MNRSELPSIDNALSQFIASTRESNNIASKMAEDVGRSVSMGAELLKCFEGKTKTSGLLEGLAYLPKTTGIDALSQFIASTTEPNNIASKTAESFGKSVSMSTERLGSSINSLLKESAYSPNTTRIDALSQFIASTAEPNNIASKTIEDFNRSLGFSDEVKRSLEHTSLLANNIGQSLSNLNIPTRPVHSSFGLDSEQLSSPAFFNPPPNPILQTNHQLSELTDTVTQLVDIAKQQAELSLAISKSADLTLKYAIQSGEDAKAATQFARKSNRMALIAIVITIITALGSIAASYKLSNSTDVRLQEEIRLLNDISNKLQSPKDVPAIRPTPSTKSTNVSKHPSNTH